MEARSLTLVSSLRLPSYARNHTKTAYGWGLLQSPGMPGNITQLLQEWCEGSDEALERLMPIVYDELRRIAGSYMRKEPADHTLQPTALLNEAYLRLIDQRKTRWQNRAHFFAIASKLMRRILVDHAKRHQAEKRGGGLRTITLKEGLVEDRRRELDLVALDDALTALTRRDERQSKLVELRFFGGLTIEETGEVLGVSPASVKRDWSLAKAWLYRELARQE